MPALTPTQEGKYNPRYVEYARYHGLTVPETLAHDRERFPGGPGAGFILFMHERWPEFDKAHKGQFAFPRSDEAHAAFDAWLPKRVDELRKAEGRS